MENKKYIIEVDKDNYMIGLYKTEVDRIMEVDEQTYNKIINGDIGYAWHYINDEWVKELVADTETLKEMRAIYCFYLLDNRSKFWWDNLTEEQNNELKQWYQDWLKVTETKVIPTKPEWLN